MYKSLHYVSLHTLCQKLPKIYKTQCTHIYYDLIY